MPSTTISGISTAADGTAYIPASKRADGTTRKALRVRPGFTPQEDVQTYKSRNAEAWKNRGSGGVPGVDEVKQPTEAIENKSKNAKRREAAKKNKADAAAGNADLLPLEMDNVGLPPSEEAALLTAPAMNHMNDNGVNFDAAEAERQKKIRNLLKRLSAVKELRMKKTAGEKLTPDQLMKLGREQEIVRELKKLDYEDLEAPETSEPPAVDGG